MRICGGFEKDSILGCGCGVKCRSDVLGGSDMSKRIAPCPFCGGKVYVSHGIKGVPFWFFKCKSCRATVSFDNDECNAEPSKAIEYFNARMTKSEVQE